MSQSEAFPAMAPHTESTVDVTSVDTESDVQALLDVLGDADCRAILEATGDTALTAAEVSAELDLPKSTAYRKLDALSELSLVEEQTRIRRSGKHATEFRRQLEDLYLTTTESGGIELRVSRQCATQQLGFSLPGTN